MAETGAPWSVAFEEHGHDRANAMKDEFRMPKYLPQRSRKAIVLLTLHVDVDAPRVRMPEAPSSAAAGIRRAGCPPRPVSIPVGSGWRQASVPHGASNR